MKRLLLLGLLIDLLLCNPLTGWAGGMGVSFYGAGTGTSAEVCTCTGTAVWETGSIEYFENADGSYCTIPSTGNTWAPTGTVNEKDTAQYKSCTASMSVTAAHGADSLIAGTVAADTNCTISFWLRMTSVAASSWTNDSGIWLFVGDTVTSDVIVALGESSDTILAYLKCSSTAGAGTVPLSTDTWYKFIIDYNDAAESTLTIYNTSLELVDTITDVCDDTSNMTSMRFGVDYNNTNQTHTFYYDDITFDPE